MTSFITGDTVNIGMQQRKITWCQRFFAQGWPMRIWFTTIPVLFAVWFDSVILPVFYPLTYWLNLLQIVFYTTIALQLGFCLTVFGAPVVIAPLCRLRARLNGAPYQEGDIVRILAGPYCDRVVRVDGFGQGNTIRVALGEQARQDTNDYFSPDALVKEDPAPLETESPPPLTSTL